MISERSLNDSIVAAVGSPWLCKDGKCGDCAISALTIKETEKKTYTDFLTEYKDLGKDFGSTTADRSLSKLSCHPTEQMWFDVMRSYSGIGQFLGIFSLFAIVLYFVTSSDSGEIFSNQFLDKPSAFLIGIFKFIRLLMHLDLAIQLP